MVDASLLQAVSTLHVVVTMLSVWHRRTECDINSFFNICSCSVEWMWTRAVLFIYLFSAIYLFCISFNLKESFVLFDTNTPPPSIFLFFTKRLCNSLILRRIANLSLDLDA